MEAEHWLVPHNVWHYESKSVNDSLYLYLNRNILSYLHQSWVDELDQIKHLRINTRINEYDCTVNKNILKKLFYNLT